MITQLAVITTADILIGDFSVWLRGQHIPYMVETLRFSRKAAEMMAAIALTEYQGKRK